MAKSTKAAQLAERLIKAKEVLDKEEEAIKKTEADVERLHALGNPIEAGLGLETATDEAYQSILQHETMCYDTIVIFTTIFDCTMIILLNIRGRQGDRHRLPGADDRVEGLDEQPAGAGAQREGLAEGSEREKMGLPLMGSLHVLCF